MKPFFCLSIKDVNFNPLEEREQMNAKNVLIASAAAVLFLTGAVHARADQSSGSAQVKCQGVNSCKGHGSCKSAQNDCKGKNACKGQSFVETSSEQDCKDKGGTVASSSN